MTIHATRDDADLELIGLGPAGVWPAWWRSFAGSLPTEWNFTSALLPGRAGRIDDPLLTTLEEQVLDVIEWVEARPAAQVPLHLLGICSGALLAHETAAHLSRAGYSDIHVHLVNPASPVGAPVLSTLSRAEFAAAAVAEGLIAQELVANPSMAELYLPALQADIAVAEGCGGLTRLGGCKVNVYLTPERPDIVQEWKRAVGLDAVEPVALSSTERALIADPASALAVPLMLQVSRAMDLL